MTLSQFASIHGLSNTTVYSYVKNGRISAFKIGDRWVIDNEENERYKREGLLPLIEKEDLDG